MVHAFNPSDVQETEADRPELKVSLVYLLSN